jgi:predicted nucleic acid-binding protein
MVFVDTSAIYALLDRSDQRHTDASHQWRRLLDSGDLLFTTNYVVVEICALAQHRLGLDAVRAIQDDILPAIEIHWIDQATHALAMAALLAARRRKLSLVDCSSFSAMRQAGSSVAFAFDGHFVEEGFRFPS